MEEWLSRRARSDPGRPAIVAGERAISYAELEAAAGRAAGRLAALGVSAGDRVATTLPAGMAFAELLHALPKLGAALVPLDPRLTAAERRWQLERSRARMVIEEPLDGDEAVVSLRRRLDPDELHCVIFTSGSTGPPKPVSLTPGNHLASALASAWNLGVASDDRWLCVLPLFHVGGLAILLRSAIYGTAAVIHDGFDADRARASLESGEASLVSLVPTMLRRLIDAGLERAPALRAALVGGGPVPSELLEWSVANGFPALQTYGMTETASQIATLAAGEAVERGGSAGRPLPGVELRVGEDGELLVRGPMVSRAAMVDGWLHTGDRGRLDAEGYLWVEGRLKDVVVTGGENVSIAEVEAALLSHPRVVDAAVTGLPDRDWGEAVSAFVVLSGEATVDQVLAHCRERLAAYKVPKRIEQVAGLPRTPAGKLLRRELGR